MMAAKPRAGMRSKLSVSLNREDALRSEDIAKGWPTPANYQYRPTRLILVISLSEPVWSQ